MDSVTCITLQKYLLLKGAAIVRFQWKSCHESEYVLYWFDDLKFEPMDMPVSFTLWHDFKCLII